LDGVIIMGTPGVPWVKDPQVIAAAIKKHKGRLTHVCKDPTIDCQYETLKRRIDQLPELQALVSDCRNHWVNSTMDKAEDVLNTLMDDIKEDRACALKAAMFSLNNLGKDRGYAAPEEKASQNQYIIKLDSNGVGTGVKLSAEKLPTSDNQSSESGN